MKISFHPINFFVHFPFVLLGLAACQKAEPPPGEPESAPVTASTATFETTDQKLSYAIGRNIGRSVGSNHDYEVDTEAMVAGLRDVLSGAESQISEDEIRAAFQDMQQRTQDAMAETKEASARFLAQNGARDGVITTASGLQYEIITVGDGAKPASEDKVKVHYHGTLIDGTVFDSSVQRGEPAEFPVTGVIPGWVEALQLMSVGSKWTLYIPADIAYGDHGQGGIPGGSALIFEVELLDII